MQTTDRPTEVNAVQLDARLYASIVDSSYDAIISKSLDGIVQSWNPAAERLFGYTAEQAVGRHISFLIPADRTDEEEQIITRLRAGERVEHYDTVRVRSDGQHVHVSLIISPVKDAEGRIVMASKIARDLSARQVTEVQLRVSEEFSRSLMDATPDCVKVLGLDGRVLHMNTPGLCAMEIDDFGPVRGKAWQALWPAGASGDIERSVTRAVGGEVSSFVAYCPTAKGAPRWWEVTVSPVRDADGGRVERLLAVSRDITERKQAEDRLRVSEGEFRAAFELSAVGMTQISVATGRFVRVNSTFCDLTGYSAEELAAMTPADLNLAEDRDADANAFGPLLRGEVASYDVEKRYVRRDGGIIWVHANATLLRDADGRPERTMGVIQDITDQRAAEADRGQLLKQADYERGRLADVFRQAPAFMCVLRGPDHVFEMANDKYHQLVGQRELLGRSVRVALPEIQGQGFLELLDTVYRTGEPIVGSGVSALLARQPDHPPEERYLDLVYQPLRDPGEAITGIVVVGVDVTDRRRAEEALRESEERYRAAIAVVSDVVWTNNSDGSMEGEQRGWGDFTGQSREEYQGHGWSIAVHPDEAQATLEAWIQAVNQKSMFIFEHRVRRHDGQWRLCSIRAVPISNADGTIREWAGVHTDITERRRDEEKLRQLAADLSEADHRKNEFLATLAHELRNPLAPIRNGLQLIKLAGGLSATVEQARSMMERQLTQMVRLVDDLMDVSRISLGKLELRKERLPLATVLHSAVETSRPLIGQMGHELTVTLPEQPLIVDADMTRLAQVFLNLLNNAAKYSDRGGHIHVKVERQDNEAVVTVTDTGIGIAADQLPRIFAMFTQLDDSLERSQGGLGIGLTLVKRLVDMHDGSIEAKSEGPGLGSEFIVRLPIVIEASLPQLSSLEDESAAKLSSRRILIVDDNRDGADSLSEMLQLMGNDTRTAYDGQQGVDMAGEYQPDVILLDIGLPKLNGYEACRRIREQPTGKSAVLIAVTGWGQDEDRRRSHEAGFDHHMIKPMDVQALMKILAGLDVGHE